LYGVFIIYEGYLNPPPPLLPCFEGTIEAVGIGTTAVQVRGDEVGGVMKDLYLCGGWEVELCAVALST
jgi:hypothetical protein